MRWNIVLTLRGRGWPSNQLDISPTDSRHVPRPTVWRTGTSHPKLQQTVGRAQPSVAGDCQHVCGVIASGTIRASIPRRSEASASRGLAHTRQIPEPPDRYATSTASTLANTLTTKNVASRATTGYVWWSKCLEGHRQSVRWRSHVCIAFTRARRRTSTLCSSLPACDANEETYPTSAHGVCVLGHAAHATLANITRARIAIAFQTYGCSTHGCWSSCRSSAVRA